MKARFRCENCGRTVPLSHDTCPHCGRRFTAVMCPVCHFEGPESLFRSGCPACGYQGETSGRRPSDQKARKPRRVLPGWFYAWSSLVLFLILIVLLLLLVFRPR